MLRTRLLTWTLALALPAALFLAPSRAAADPGLSARTRAGETVAIEARAQRLDLLVEGDWVQVRQRDRFYNPSAEAVEGRYHFIAGEQAQVLGYAYWRGEEKIVGEVFERETARAIYETVTDLGRDPGLLEQEGEGSFSFRVFPIPAQQEFRVETQWGRWLSRSADTVELRVPLSKAQTIDLELIIPDGAAIEQIDSPTHRIEKTSLPDGGLSIRLKTRGQGSDFVLRWQDRAAVDSLRSSYHRDAGHRPYLALSYTAPTRRGNYDRRLEQDLSLVIDRSGSMSGEPLKQAKAAARALIEELETGDHINLLVFDDHVESLYEAPRALDQGVREELLAFIDGIDDGGGTDIAGALEVALGAQRLDARPDTILFLTDGQSDSQAALAIARADRGDARVFTVGLGAGVERPLMARLAAEKRGRFVFVDSPEALVPKMQRLWSGIARPGVADLELKVTPAANGPGPAPRLTQVYPRSLPDLAPGETIRIVARVENPAPMQIQLRGRDGQSKWMRRVDADPQSPHAQPSLGRAWASARVEDLQQEIALMGESDEHRDEAIELALAYRLVTPYTSFLAIPEDELSGEAQLEFEQAREARKRLLARHQDAVALSRDNMPPGDPLLEFQGPADARSVTARFPFGLELALAWDPERERWRTRFLVPVGVPSGAHPVQLRVEHADGSVSHATVEYWIDSEEPRLDLKLVEKGERRWLVAEGESDLASVRMVILGEDVASPARLGLPQAKMRETKPGQYRALLPKSIDPRSRGQVRVRIVAEDRARNVGIHECTLAELVPERGQ